MRSSLRNLQMDELIVHDIPKKLSQRVLRETPDTQAELPVFSQVASPVNATIVGFFHDKITGTIGSTAALDVIFNPLSASPIGTLMNEYFTGNENRRILITHKSPNICLIFKTLKIQVVCYYLYVAHSENKLY